MENKFLNCFCLTLTIIGAVNWGLIGFFNFNLVALIFGEAQAGFPESSTHWSDFRVCICSVSMERSAQ